MSAPVEQKKQTLAFITPDWGLATGGRARLPMQREDSEARQLGRVRAAFTLRTGGVSEGPYAYLNLGTHVGDAPAAVSENRRRVREALELPAEPVWLQQIHGAAVLDLDELPGRMTGSAAPSGVAQSGVRVLRAGATDDAHAGLPQADAVVTRMPGRVCVIQVADCMPVLLAARDGSAVGGAHAGWRGLAGGVLEATVQKLGVAPEDLVAWMGPSISREHFEVGEDVRTAFVDQDVGAAVAFRANARGRWQCDLDLLARRKLEAVGVTAVSGGGWCTYAQSESFFSARRDKTSGRMAALIWMA